MSKVLLTSLLASGFLFGANDVRVNRLSSTDRDALATQTPTVKTQGMKKHSKHNKKSVLPGYRVVSRKQTINAFVPLGK
jgi:hypothetical protein